MTMNYLKELRRFESMDQQINSEKRTSSYSFLDAASRIGDKICDQAYWFAGMCNWMGIASNNSGKYFQITNRALDPSVYGGTSGIGLFLSYLYYHTGTEKFRMVAEGAISQALNHYKVIPPNTRFGLYNGWLGIAYVAIKSGSMLKNNVLVEKGLNILSTLSLEYKTGDHLIDIINGNASAIPCLLNIYSNITHDEKMYSLAIKLGEELISLSKKERSGWSWAPDSRTLTIKKNLTGFAHGTAGFGYSLLELFNSTNRKDFEQAARKAFTYENYWFNEKNSNWPDFRIDPDISLDTASLDLRYSTAWCHGAPGIGLSRIRAYEILKDKKYLRDTQAAVRATIEFIKNQSKIIPSRTYLSYNYSLCHGLAGNCELLIHAQDILKNRSFKSIYTRIGIYGITNYLITDQPFPCGGPPRESPDLMLGLAGIGYFYLRIFDPKKTPSILMILSE